MWLVCEWLFGMIVFFVWFVVYDGVVNVDIDEMNDDEL